MTDLFFLEFHTVIARNLAAAAPAESASAGTRLACAVASGSVTCGAGGAQPLVAQ